MKRTIMFKTTLIKIYILVSGVLFAQNVGITDPSLVRDSLQIINKTSPERAIRYAREILSRCDPVEDKKLESQILNTLGEIYLDLNLFWVYVLDRFLYISLNFFYYKCHIHLIEH